MAASGPVLAIGPAGPTWKPRELVATGVEPQDQLGADRILAFDHYGEPAIAFKAGTAFGDIRYARNLPGVGWVAQDVFPQTGTNGRGVHPCLGFDRHERPAISFRSGDPAIVDTALRLSYFDGNAWQHQLVDFIQGNDSGSWSHLAFDLFGHVAVAYYDETNNRIRFVHDTDGDFDLSNNSPEIVTAFPVGTTGEHISFAFDDLNRPTLCYVTNRGALVYAIKESLGWFSGSVDTGPGTELAASLAIDPATGFPAIAYTSDTGTTSLKYAAWNGLDWIITTVDNNGSTGLTPSLAFDPVDGNPAIAYHGTGQTELHLAWFDGSTWQNAVVDAAGGGAPIGINPSLAFREFGDGERVAAIAYHDNSGNLWYIEDPPATVAGLAYFVSDRQAGVIWRLQDRNGDGDALDAGEQVRWGEGLTLAGEIDHDGCSLFAVNAGLASGSNEVVRFTDINRDGDALDIGEREVWATGLDAPGGITSDDSGVRYVTEVQDGEVWRLEDLNMDGDALDAGERTLYAAGLGASYSVTYQEGTLLVSSAADEAVIRLTDGNADGDALDAGEQELLTPTIDFPLGVTDDGRGGFYVSSYLGDAVYHAVDRNADGDMLDAGELLLFADEVFGGVDGPWGMTLLGEGSLLLAEFDDGEILWMRDANGDGDALDLGETRLFATGLVQPVDIVPELPARSAVRDLVISIDGGLLTVEWLGPAECAFTVEHDEDLVAPWTPSLLAPTFLGNGRWRWQDPDWQSFPGRFYRVRN